ncbi:MAG: hypothetical protein J6U54_09970 [Clostridiales bacterium]|nr:hypothetical protein [Clostridiales bacterium]
MFNIFDKQLLKITQGNSVEVLITLTDTDTGLPITIGEGDKVLFTVKNQNGITVIQKTLTSNDLAEDGYSIIMTVLPEETNIMTGEYPYDVLLVTLDGQAVTFISSTVIITPAVGLYTDVGGGDS